MDLPSGLIRGLTQLTPKLGNVSDLTPTPIVITVTVENAGSGASVEYTVNLSQAD